jgi:hypothetical protein
MTRKYHSAQGAVDWVPFDVSGERPNDHVSAYWAEPYHNKPDLQDERSEKVCEEVGRCAMGEALVDEGRLRGGVGVAHLAQLACDSISGLSTDQPQS